MWGAAARQNSTLESPFQGVQYWLEGGDYEWALSIHRDWNGVDSATETSYVRFLELFRVQQLDILTISEMHNSENEKTSFERVYIEETLCIFGSKVGIMLSLAARRAYEAANSRTKVVEGRYLAVQLRWSSDDTGQHYSGGDLFPYDSYSDRT